MSGELRVTCSCGVEMKSSDIEELVLVVSDHALNVHDISFTRDEIEAMVQF